VRAQRGSAPGSLAPGAAREPAAPRQPRKTALRAPARQHLLGADGRPALAALGGAGAPHGDGGEQGSLHKGYGASRSTSGWQASAGAVRPSNVRLSALWLSKESAHSQRSRQVVW